jgi:hypothetical protein
LNGLAQLAQSRLMLRGLEQSRLSISDNVGLHRAAFEWIGFHRRIIPATRRRSKPAGPPLHGSRGNGAAVGYNSAIEHRFVLSGQIERHSQMEFINRIVGSDKLIAVFGYWPTFHDAEVIWLRLDRRSSDAGSGPTLEALVHTFEMTSDVGPDGYYVLRNHVQVHFRFSEVIELRLEGFNYQNVLLGLGVSDLRELGMERVRFDVRLDSSFGVEALFQCRAIEIVDVVQCDKRGEPLTS